MWRASGREGEARAAYCGRLGRDTPVRPATRGQGPGTCRNLTWPALHVRMCVLVCMRWARQRRRRTGGCGCRGSERRTSQHTSPNSSWVFFRPGTFSPSIAVDDGTLASWAPLSSPPSPFPLERQGGASKHGREWVSRVRAQALRRRRREARCPSSRRLPVDDPEERGSPAMTCALAGAGGRGELGRRIQPNGT